jgi:MarR-like DNA-binding transcriptional regulator SgrR of sgrS sRNA
MDFLTKDSAMPVYLVFPRFLLDSDLGETAKLLYIVLLDRARLSQQDARWRDEQGRVFLYFPIRDLAVALHKSEMTVKTALGALERAGLIQRKHQGTGKANQLYVKIPTDRFLSSRRTENFPSGRQKTVYQADRKLSTSNNYRVKTNYQKYPGYDIRNYDYEEYESL